LDRLPRTNLGDLGHVNDNGLLLHIAVVETGTTRDLALAIETFVDF
jgi:hypothetical protein